MTDVIGGRDAPRPGVSGKLVLDRRAGADVAAAGRRASTTPRGSRSRGSRPGDVVVTLGVGEPWRIARAVVEGLPA